MGIQRTLVFRVAYYLTLIQKSLRNCQNDLNAVVSVVNTSYEDFDVVCLCWQSRHFHHGDFGSKTSGITQKTLSTFFLFRKDTIGTLKAQRPDLSLTELSAELGRMWKNLPESTLNKYKAKKEKDMEVYRDQMAQVSPDVLEAKKKEGREKRLKKIKMQISFLQTAMGKPKTGANGFSIFLSEEILKLPAHLAQKEKFKMASDKWATLSDDLKADYNKLGAEMNDKRAKELEAWKEKMKDTEDMKKLQGLLEKKNSLMALIRKKEN